ncbi:MAG: ROK family protein [Thermacetogeniaceae bacterium]|jgi:glucokinase|nr:ROK family protein [Thermoanaerobacterales bacterium]
MDKVLAVDLGGTKIYSALVGRGGEIICEDKCLTGPEKGVEAVIERITNSLKCVCPACEQPLGIGVAVPAYIDSEKGVILFAPNLKWRDVDLKRALEESFNLPVWMDNDANLAALGEHRYGAGRGYHDLVYITVSTGVGGGLILNNQLYRGAFGGAGEFGHMIVDAHGPICSCGNKGCLEGLASGCAIMRDARDLVRSDRGKGILAAAEGIEGVDACAVGKAALEGDPEAKEILAAAGRYLGMAIASVANLLNPEMFIIGGGVACGVGELLLEPAYDEAYRRTYPPYREQLKIIPAALKGRSGLLGAAAYAWDQLQQGNPSGD